MKTELILYTQQLIQNSKFSLILDYGWGYNIGYWTKNEGSITKVTGAADVLYQLNLLTNGVTYRLKFNITGRTAGNITFRNKTGGTVFATYTTNGDKSLDFTADGIDTLFTASTTFDGTISNVTIHALPLTYSLDLTDDIPIPLTFNIENIFNIATRKTAFSRTVILKGTHNNNIAFNQIYKINSDSLFNPNIVSRVVIKNSGIKLLDGTLCLDNVTKKIQSDGIEDIEYSVSITGPVADIYTKLGTKTVRDLDFSAYDHDYTIGEVQGSWFGVNEINGAPGSVNRISTASFTVASETAVTIGGLQRIKLDFTTPHDFVAGEEVYVQPNDTQCNFTGGANYLFDQLVIDTPSSTSIILDCYSPTGAYSISSPSNAQQVSRDYFEGIGYYYPTVNYGTYMKLQYPQPLGAGLLVVGEFYIIKIYNSGDDFTNVGGVTNTQGEIFQATGSTPAVWAGSVLLRYRDINIPLGEDTLISKWFNDPQEGCDSQWEVYDYIPHIFAREVLLKMFKTTDYEYNCPFFDSKFFRRLVIPLNQTMQVKEGKRVIMNNWLPAIKLTDFLNSILNMFNLAMTVEDRLLTFVNRGEFFDNPSIDWSDKIDINQPLMLNMMNTNQPKSYQFKYKKSTDYFNLLYDTDYGNITNNHNLINRVDRNYGDYYTEVRSDYLTKNNKVELCFEPSLLTSIDAFGGPNTTLFGDSRIVMTTSYVSSLDRTNITRKELPKILIAGLRWIYVEPAGGAAFPANYHLSSQVTPSSNLANSYYYGYGGHIDNHFQQTPTQDINWFTPLGYYFDKAYPGQPITPPPFPTLTIGTTYIIVSSYPGDDFTNVGAANNNVGTKFTATGTTPTQWTAFVGTKLITYPVASPSVPSDLRISTWAINSLYPKYWQRYLDHLTDVKAKTVTGYFKLDLLDIYKLDFSRPVKVGDLTMKLSKVIDWNVNGSGVCKCEFLVNK
jgi:hypothetical protein